MINHHPSPALLQQFAEGSLPASIAIGIAIHNQMCPQCRNEVELLTQQQAQTEFSSFALEPAQAHGSPSLSDMLDGILNSQDSAEPLPKASIAPQTLEVRGQRFPMPLPLRQVKLNPWRNLGKLTRASLDLDEGKVHSHLLLMEPGGEVPCHTHKGYEITLILEGSFEDEMGRYQKGDFIYLDAQHNHQPKTKEGCLCYTVADDALHFTRGVHRLFNPIGSLLY